MHLSNCGYPERRASSQAAVWAGRTFGGEMETRGGYGRLIQNLSLRASRHKAPVGQIRLRTLRNARHYVGQTFGNSLNKGGLIRGAKSTQRRINKKGHHLPESLVDILHRGRVGDTDALGVSEPVSGDERHAVRPAERCVPIAEEEADSDKNKERSTTTERNSSCIATVLNA